MKYTKLEEKKTIYIYEQKVEKYIVTMDEGTWQWKGWMVGGGAARIISFLIGHWTTKQEENNASWILTSILPTVYTPNVHDKTIQIEIERATCDDIRNNNFENDHLYVIKIVVIWK